MKLALRLKLQLRKRRVLSRSVKMTGSARCDETEEVVDAAAEVEALTDEEEVVVEEVSSEVIVVAVVEEDHVVLLKSRLPRRPTCMKRSCLMSSGAGPIQYGRCYSLV